MYLLAYRDTDGVGDNLYIINHPDGIDYSWLFTFEIIIAELKLTPRGKKKDLKCVELYRMYCPYNFVHENIPNYNWIKFFPKAILKFLIEEWKKHNERKLEKFSNSVKYLEENLDKIYNEIMIKDIIE